jgi:hypothetical protein
MRQKNKEIKAMVNTWFQREEGERERFSVFF